MTTCPDNLSNLPLIQPYYTYSTFFCVSCRICGFVIRSATLVYLMGKVNLNESGITLFKSNKKTTAYYDLRS